MAGWFSKLTGQGDRSAEPLVEINTPDATPLREGEVHPPWVEQPTAAPDDFYWREAGEPWLTQVWEPYFNALSPADQELYLARWKVPQDWQDSYFDRARREFWDHVDDPD